VSPACASRRAFASEANPQPKLDANASASTKAIPSWKVEGRMRPQPNQPLSIDPNHPLYAFFRQDVWSNRQDDLPVYLPFEPYWAARFASGRPWTARELRRKSFQDLHVLWYVLARERNLLATQRQTVARYGMKDRTRFSYPDLDLKCRTSMARIKQVLNERRIACLGAAQLLLERGELTPNSDGASQAEQPTDDGNVAASIIS